MWLIEKKFGAKAARAHRQRVEAAKTDSLRPWFERILTAETVEALLR